VLAPRPGTRQHRLRPLQHQPREGPARGRRARHRLHRGPKRLSTRVRQRGRDGGQGSEDGFAQAADSWRRARDSNPQGPRGPVDFKSEPPLPSPCRDRSSSLLIMPLRGSLAWL